MNDKEVVAATLRHGTITVYRYRDGGYGIDVATDDGRTLCFRVGASNEQLIESLAKFAGWRLSDLRPATEVKA